MSINSWGIEVPFHQLWTVDHRHGKTIQSLKVEISTRWNDGSLPYYLYFGNWKDSDMDEFINYCNKISPLTVEAIADLKSRIESKTFKKGQIINKEGQICRTLFFINKGLVKHYYIHKDRKYIIRFFSENNVFTVLDSFIQQTPAVFSTIALETTDTTYLSYEDVQELCKTHHCFETFIRKTFGMASIINLKRIKEMFDADATELYKNFIGENQHLLQRISLGDIACYLGISQVTLSRIRAKP